MISLATPDAVEVQQTLSQEQPNVESMKQEQGKTVISMELPKKPVPMKMSKFMDKQNQNENTTVNHDQTPVSSLDISPAQVAPSAVHFTPVQPVDEKEPQEERKDDEINNEEEPEVSALTGGVVEEHKEDEKSSRLSVSEIKNRFKGSASPVPPPVSSHLHSHPSSHVQHHPIRSHSPMTTSSHGASRRMVSPAPPAHTTTAPVRSYSPAPVPYQRASSPVAGTLSSAPPIEQPMPQPVPYRSVQPPPGVYRPTSQAPYVPEPKTSSLTRQEESHRDEARERAPVNTGRQHGPGYQINQNQSTPERSSFPFNLQSRRVASPTPSQGSSSVMGRQTPSRHLHLNPVVVQPVGLPDLGPISPSTVSLDHKSSADISPNSADMVKTNREFPSIEKVASSKSKESPRRGAPSLSIQQEFQKDVSMNPSPQSHVDAGRSHFNPHQRRVDHHQDTNLYSETDDRSSPALPTRSTAVTRTLQHHSNDRNVDREYAGDQSPRLETSSSVVGSGRVTIETPESVSVSKFKAQFEKPENVALRPEKSSVVPGKWNQQRSNASEVRDSRHEQLNRQSTNQGQNGRPQVHRDVAEQHDSSSDHPSYSTGNDEDQHAQEMSANQPKPSIMNYWKNRIDGTGNSRSTVENHEHRRAPGSPPRSPSRKTTPRSSPMISTLDNRFTASSSHTPSDSVTEVPVEGNSRAVIEVPEKQSVANMADRFQHIPPKGVSPQVRLSESPTPYRASQGELRSPTSRRSTALVESTSASGRWRNVAQPSPTNISVPSPSAQDFRWRSTSPVHSEASNDFARRKNTRQHDAMRNDPDNQPLSPGHARVLQEQARWRSPSPQGSEASSNNKFKSSGRPSWVRPVDTSPGRESHEPKPDSPSRLTPRNSLGDVRRLQGQSITPRSLASPSSMRARDGTLVNPSPLQHGSDTQRLPPGSPHFPSPRNRPQQTSQPYGRKFHDVDDRSEASGAAPSMRRALSPSSHQNRGHDQPKFSNDRKYSDVQFRTDRDQSPVIPGHATENAVPNPRSPIRGDSNVPGMHGRSQEALVGHPGGPRPAYLTSPPTLPAEARSKDAFQELQQKLLKRQHDIEVTSMASTPNIENSSAMTVARATASIMDNDGYGDEKKSSEADEVQPIRDRSMHAESPRTLGELAAQSIHAMDYDQESLEHGGNSKSSSPTVDDEALRNYTSSVPNTHAVPPEFAATVSPPRYSEGKDSHHRSQMEMDHESEVVFGDPETYGAAGGGVDRAPPTVADRAKAIADWKGGMGTKPRSGDLTDKPSFNMHVESETKLYPLYEDSPDQGDHNSQGIKSDRVDSSDPNNPSGASAVLRFWNQTTAEELENAEQFKDEDPGVADYVSDVQLSDIHEQTQVNTNRLISPSTVRELRHFRNRSDGQTEGTEKPNGGTRAESRSGTDVKAPDPFSPNAINDLKAPTKTSNGTFSAFWGESDNFDRKSGFGDDGNTFSDMDAFPVDGFVGDNAFGFEDMDKFGSPTDGFALSSEPATDSGFDQSAIFGSSQGFDVSASQPDGFDSSGFPSTDAFSSTEPIRMPQTEFNKKTGHDSDGFPMAYEFANGADGFPTDHVISASNKGATSHFSESHQPSNEFSSSDPFSSTEHRMTVSDKGTTSHLTESHQPSNEFSSSDPFSSTEHRMTVSDKGTTSHFTESHQPSNEFSSTDPFSTTEHMMTVSDQGTTSHFSESHQPSNEFSSTDPFSTTEHMMTVSDKGTTSHFSESHQPSNEFSSSDPFGPGFSQSAVLPDDGFGTGFMTENAYDEPESMPMETDPTVFPSDFVSGQQNDQPIQEGNVDSDDLFLPSSSSSQKAEDNAEMLRSQESNLRPPSRAEDNRGATWLPPQRSNLSQDTYQQRQQSTFDRLYDEESTQEPIWSFETGIGTYFERDRQKIDPAKAEPAENAATTELPRIEETPRSTAVEI